MHVLTCGNVSAQVAPCVELTDHKQSGYSMLDISQWNPYNGQPGNGNLQSLKLQSWLTVEPLATPDVGSGGANLSAMVHGQDNISIASLVGEFLAPQRLASGNG
ncbi:hypothetical protein Dda_8406 [Drechslerella dactyloides]|uniref:Uncharacterized protein n=1 Tax=Drechslerella dactyloides TaxID=74499 RepID=A0AAD6IQE3_DREDA|nr:hypothetical protein Dda_8406 [Drechslerella dactyloides]